MLYSHVVWIWPKLWIYWSAEPDLDEKKQCSTFQTAPTFSFARKFHMDSIRRSNIIYFSISKHWISSNPKNYLFSEARDSQTGASLTFFHSKITLNIPHRFEKVNKYRSTQNFPLKRKSFQKICMNKSDTSLRTEPPGLTIILLLTPHIFYALFLFLQNRKRNQANRRRDGVVTLLAEFFISLPARWLVSKLYSQRTLFRIQSSRDSRRKLSFGNDRSLRFSALSRADVTKDGGTWLRLLETSRLYRFVYDGAVKCLCFDVIVFCVVSNYSCRVLRDF